jgi:phage tail-like protein
MSAPDPASPSATYAEFQGTTEISGFVAYTGPGFAEVRPAPERGADPTPAPATNRRYLRDGLPALYREQPFAMHFVSAFEAGLDPIVALLDGLPSHFSPDLAPLDVLELLSAWLGVEPDEQQSTARLRDLVAHATELGRLRGTRAGIELALRLGFPQLPLRVEDGGGVAWGLDGTLPIAAPPSFVVYCDEAIPREEAANVARVIESLKPVHVGYRLRIKGPRAVSDASI